jgi:hypothetical protein
MGKHATDAQKVEFLTYLEYVSVRKVAKKAGLAPSTTKDIKAKVADL